MAQDVNTLSKNWKGFLTGMALASTPSQAQDMPSQGQKQQKYDLSVLHPDLHAIAMLESSGGKNTAHMPHSQGDFHTAVGAVGLKPITGHEMYQKYQHLQKLFPNLHDQGKFVEEMKKNPNFYNALASQHWNHLKGKVKDVSNTAYAWRHGLGAALKATPEQIKADPYVKKYNEISGKLGKSELSKAEKLENPHKAIEKLGSAQSGQMYSYDHLLSPMHISEGYSIRLNDLGNKWDVSLLNNGIPVGGVQVEHNSQHPLLQDKISVGDAYLNGPDALLGHPGHRGRGLGTPLYESVYAHAKNKGNVKHAIGGAYSGMAMGVHQRLAEKHGLNFVSHPYTQIPVDPFESEQNTHYVIPTDHMDKYTEHKSRYPEKYHKSEKPMKLSLTERIYLKLNDKTSKKSNKKTETGDFSGWLNSVVESSFA
jgi:GNAT superfamily N-acetyltransferase